MRRQAATAVVAWLAACGPEAKDDPPEDPLWMTGVWSFELMTEDNTGLTFEGGFDSDPGQPAWFEIFEDGTFEFLRTVSPGQAGTFGSTWELVGDGEIIAEPTEPLSSYEESLRGYRWKRSTGERGCDAIEATRIRDTGEGEPFYLYRGAVCSYQPEPCPDDASPVHSCWYWTYEWCEHQGTNEAWREDLWGPDRYCHLPGYEEEEED